jgi:hypothetical protein
LGVGFGVGCGVGCGVGAGAAPHLKTPALRLGNGSQMHTGALTLHVHRWSGEQLGLSGPHTVGFWMLYEHLPCKLHRPVNTVLLAHEPWLDGHTPHCGPIGHLQRPSLSHVPVLHVSDWHDEPLARGLRAHLPSLHTFTKQSCGCTSSQSLSRRQPSALFDEVSCASSSSSAAVWLSSSSSP